MSLRTSIDVHAGILGLIDEWITAYVHKDIETLMRIISPANDCIFVGTGPDEVSVGRDATRARLERDLAQAEAVRVHMGNVHVSGRGDVAWVFARPTMMATLDGHTVPIELRMTAVCVREGEDWHLHTGHLSVPHADQAAGNSFPARST